MALQGFSKKTLNGNWYEQRLAIEQTYQRKPDMKLKREKEPDINCLSSSGLPAPLGSIYRKPKQETTGLIPDDGFRELKTTAQQEIQKPAVHTRKEKPILRMINKYNIGELNLVDRPVNAPETGFGAVIHRHDASYAARSFRTETRDNFGERAKQSPAEATATFQKASKTQAGGNLRPGEQ